MTPGYSDISGSESSKQIKKELHYTKRYSIFQKDIDFYIRV